MLQINVKSSKRVEMIDITKEVTTAILKSGIKSGICLIFVPHTTAAITINENADPTVKEDIIKEINKIVPFEDSYQHLEGNSAAHIKCSLFSPEIFLIIENGRPVLGTWQGIYFCEFDGPRRRKVYLKILSE